jgi:hypothetical protein
MTQNDIFKANLDEVSELYDIFLYVSLINNFSLSFKEIKTIQKIEDLFC